MIYTPKQGNWLNMAEIALNVFKGQCLNRGMDNIETIRDETRSWCEYQNNMKAKINWQFTTQNARIKLKTLYPKIQG